MVNKGDFLLEIDPTGYESIVDQLQAAIRAGEAALEMEKANLAKARYDLAKAETLLQVADRVGRRSEERPSRRRCVRGAGQVRGGEPLAAARQPQEGAARSEGSPDHRRDIGHDHRAQRRRGRERDHGYPEQPGHRAHHHLRSRRDRGGSPRRRDRGRLRQGGTDAPR